MKLISSLLSLSGTKATKAQSWSIPIVNHTWLEDCFIQWRNLTVGLEKYIGFPNGVDFSKLLGVRGVSVAVDVEGLDAEVDAEEGERAPNGTDASLKEVQGLIASEDVDMVDEPEEVPIPVVDDDGGDEDELTLTKKDLTSKSKVNGTSPLSNLTSSRISPEKLVAEHDYLESDEKELNTNGKRKPKNLVSPESGKKSTRIQKQKKANKKTLASSDEDSSDIILRNIEALAAANKIQVSSDDDSSDTDRIIRNIDALAAANKPVSSDDDSEMEMILRNIKAASSKGKEKQVKPRSGKSTTRDGDDSEVEVVSSKVAKTNLNAKGKKKGKASTRPKESKKDDEEDQDDDEDMEEMLKVSKKKIHSNDQIKLQPRSTKPKPKARGQNDDAMEADDEEVDGEEENTKSNGVVKVGKKREVLVDENEDDKEESDDELSLPLPIPLTPPPRAKSTKLIRRVSQAVVQDGKLDAHSNEVSDKEQGKGKSRLSLVEKSQAGRRDARTRVRKRKSDIVEAEVDEDEQEEPVAKSSSTKKKTKAETASTSVSASVKVKEKPRVHYSDSDDSDLPAAPILSSMNGKKDKRVSGGSTSKKKTVVSVSVPAAKSTKSKPRGRGTVESEDGDGDDVPGSAVVTAPKRAISVLMPSFNLSANKKGGTSVGVKEVENRRSRKKAKLSVSSEEDDKTHDEEEVVSPRSRAITRTDSIRVMSNHHVQAPTKNSGATSSSVKKNANAVISSSKSKPKSKPAQMDVDNSPSPLSRATKTATKPSPATKAPLKRSAAAKATQRLHDTIMPDLVNFETQMKRSRKSGGMSAFRIESERKDGSGGKRSQDRDADEDGEERVKKRRRVDVDDDDVVESVSVNAKGKGKRKVREEEEEEEGEGEEEEQVRAKRRSSSSKGKGKPVVIVVSDKEEAGNEDEDKDEEDVVASSKGAKLKTQGKEKEGETP